MLKRFVHTLLVALVLVVGVITGYVTREFLRLQDENLELKRIALDAMDVSRLSGDTANSCLISLNSCTRIINQENPQIRDGMMQLEAKRGLHALSVSQRRGP